MSVKIKVRVPKVQIPAESSLDPNKRDVDNSLNDNDDMIFHISIGYKTLSFMVVIFLQVVYVYADLIAQGLGYESSP